ncbi:MAG: hypothetical protein IT435_14380 [Phycisphaerales bacterium]|nr:hypothetical protein [Phycisphaerales bacterium]
MEGFAPHHGAPIYARGHEARDGDWGASGGGHGALCILWHPRGSTPDAELTQTLQKRGFRTILCDNAIEATAWLCRAAAGRPNSKVATSASPLVLLMDRPGLLLGSDDCHQVIEMYVPSAACWIHDPTASPRLRAGIRVESPSRATRSGRSGSFPGQGAAGRGKPALRLTSDVPMREVKPARAMEDEARGVDADDAGNEFISGTGRGSPRDLLSDEELQMLLGDAGSSPEQPPHPPGHHRP